MQDFLGAMEPELEDLANSETAVLTIEQPTEVTTPESDDKDFERDFKEVQGQLKKIAENGMHAIEKLSTIADESEHPRTFEVLSTLMKNTAEISKNVLDVHEQKRTFKGISVQPKDTGINVEQAVIVGSTSDLLKSLSINNE